MYFNKNPFNDRMSHIPYTHYDSTRLDSFNIFFMYGSIESKLNSFNIPTATVFSILSRTNDSISSEENKTVMKYLSDMDLEAILILNEVLGTMFTSGTNTLSGGSVSYGAMDNGQPVTSLRNRVGFTYDTLASLIMKYDHNQDTYLQASKSKVENFNLVDDPTSDTLNIIDTGVPTDLYYTMSIIDAKYLKVTIYNHFFTYLLNKDKNNLYDFIKKLLIKANEQLTLDELARTQLFRNYINILGTSQI